MKQIDFEYLIMQDMNIPRALTRHLIKNLIAELTHRMRIGDLAIIVNLGTFYTVLRPALHYRDWRTGIIRISFPVNIVKMRRWSFPKQQCTPSWIPVRWDNKTKTHAPVVFIGQKPYPDSNFAHYMVLRTGLDLLTINTFLNSFTLQIKNVVVANDKVVINHLGTFTKQRHLPHRIMIVRHTGYITIPEFDTLKFRPSKTLLRAVN